MLCTLISFSLPCPLAKCVSRRKRKLGADHITLMPIGVLCVILLMIWMLKAEAPSLWPFLACLRKSHILQSRLKCIALLWTMAEETCFKNTQSMSSSENGSVSPNLSRASQPEPSWSPHCWSLKVLKKILVHIIINCPLKNSPLPRSHS